VAHEDIEGALLSLEQWMTPALIRHRDFSADPVFTASWIQLNGGTDRMGSNLEPPAAAEGWHLVDEALLGHLYLLFDARDIVIHRIGGTGPGNAIILSEVRGFEALIGWINNLGGQIGGGRCALLEHVTVQNASHWQAGLEETIPA